jgi:hypothetical protein
MLKELHDIREVINVYPGRRRKRKECTHTTLTKTSELPDQLNALLQLDKYKV